MLYSSYCMSIRLKFAVFFEDIYLRTVMYAKPALKINIYPEYSECY